MRHPSTRDRVGQGDQSRAKLVLKPGDMLSVKVQEALLPMPSCRFAIDLAVGNSV